MIIAPLILAVPGVVTGFYGFSDFHAAVMTTLPSLALLSKYRYGDIFVKKKQNAGFYHIHSL